MKPIDDLLASIHSIDVQQVLEMKQQVCTPQWDGEISPMLWAVKLILGTSSPDVKDLERLLINCKVNPNYFPSKYAWGVRTNVIDAEAWSFFAPGPVDLKTGFGCLQCLNGAVNSNDEFCLFDCLLTLSTTLLNRHSFDDTYPTDEFQIVFDLDRKAVEFRVPMSLLDPAQTAEEIKAWGLDNRKWHDKRHRFGIWEFSAGDAEPHFHEVFREISFSLETFLTLTQAIREMAE